MKRFATGLLFAAFVILVMAGLYRYVDIISTDIEYNVMENIHTNLSKQGLIARDDIDVRVDLDGRDVTLSGSTENTKLRTAIETAIQSSLGVRMVKNNISVLSSATETPMTQQSDVSSPSPARKTLVLDTIVCDPDVCVDKLNTPIARQKLKEQLNDNIKRESQP